jgi:hypothetical protein
VGFGFSVGTGDGVAAGAVVIGDAVGGVAEAVAFAPASGLSACEPQAMAKTMSAKPAVRAGMSEGYGPRAVCFMTNPSQEKGRVACATHPDRYATTR